jgi:hypothetical protein
MLKSRTVSVVQSYKGRQNTIRSVGDSDQTEDGNDMALYNYNHCSFIAASSLLVNACVLLGQWR